MLRVTVGGVLALASAPPALASEASQNAVSQGLEAMSAGRGQVAVQFFSRALDLDPVDADARYYRGVARVGLGEFETAIADLSQVAAERPDMEAAQLALGYAHYGAADYGQAERYLARAGEEEGAAANKARFYLGMSRLRQGQARAAAATFATVADGDPKLGVTARYYHGVAALRAGDVDAARSSFTSVRDNDEKPVLAKAAAQQLERMPAGAQKPYRLYGSLGFEYDSNVVLVAEDGSLRSTQLDDVGVSDEEDGRTVITAGAVYVPYRSDSLDVSVGYEFFQSLHFDLSEFDIQDHRASASLTYKLAPFSGGLVGTYDYYLRDGESFLGEAGLFPWLRHTDDRWGDTDLYYRWRNRSFHGIHFGKELDVLRDGMNNAVGARHTLLLAEGGGHLSLGYRYDRDDSDHADGRGFEYDGHLGELEFGWKLPAAIDLVTGYAYKREIYDGASDGRRDNEHHASLALRKGVGHGLSVAAGYRATVNDSNDDNFEYTRHVASVALEARY